ncbi:beta/gamma crystallin-related protein [Asticcacaulis sp. ZE23SCel15]|uniref:beta/gamma crystallin-related protein n=1 Tax=Asticcacaulis sp. ZE23SCel15 TaxID=3059027 RepID=UPI00265EB54E|nr:beta/gamma crystallin-related protein [Asticcacaulis sp. ZE23SCel15]WKL58381.1 beta/gamma crystallin-related protein [Asticcacaulis sp. ZE23SCel15]
MFTAIPAIKSRTLMWSSLSALAACAIVALSPASASAQAEERHWGGGPGGNNLPEGNYRQSCRDIDVRRGQLTAQCRTKNGGYRYTSLSLRDCRRGWVENRNGNLWCEVGGYPGGPGGGYPGGPGGGGGGGGYGSSLTLYSSNGFNGRSITINDAITDLSGMRFNDVARSLDVRGRGAWEVCENAFFRGRCTVVDGSYESLRRIGLEGHISSVRPVRR